MPPTPTPPNKDAMPPERNPSPRTRRRAMVILGIVFAIIVVLYLGMNISHFLAGPAMHDEPEAQTGP